MLVVATTEDGSPAICTLLRELGLEVVRVAAPGDVRRLVLAAAGDEWAAEDAAATLRDRGFAAVNRPDGGARLDQWVRHTEPITFGDRLSICFAWSEHDRAGLRNVIELGGGGFGNGEHPATRLLIEELVGRISGGERVLDVGCGSGVLGLAALALGADEVVAVDRKPEAVVATNRNAALNGLDGRVRATVRPLAELTGQFDVTVANIGRSAIVELAPDLVRALRPGGWLAVSGISPAQCALVAGFLRPLLEIERRTSGEWASVVLGHDGPDAARP